MKTVRSGNFVVVTDSMLSTNVVITGGTVAVADDAVISRVLTNFIFAAFDVSFSRP
jgi:hypothetical protein